MFCTNCGKQLEEGMKFCTNCGKPVAMPESAPVEPAESAEGAADQQTTVLSDSADQQTTVLADAADQQTTVLADAADQQTAVLSDAAAQPTAVLSDASDQQTAVLPGNAAPATQTFSPQPQPGVAPVAPAMPVPAPATQASQKDKRPVVVIVVAIVVALLLVAGLTVFALFHFGVIGGASGSQTPQAEQPAAAEQKAAEDDVEDEDKNSAKVPNVVGMTQDAATAEITSAGFLTPTIVTEHSSKVAKGNVISQSPQAGETMNTSTSKITLTVSSGPTTVTQKEYTVIAQPLNWADAKAYCESNGGRLATIANETEYQQVLDAANASGLKVLWLGAQRSGSSFTWVNGEPMSFTAWAAGEPNDDQGIEDYVALFNVNGSWAWYDVPSSFDGVYKEPTRGFVMERMVEVPVQ